MVGEGHPAPERKTLLSLDGGGTWAILQVHALARLFGEETPGTKILKRFSLSVGCSGGSIVLAALAVDKTPKEIMGLLTHGNLRRVYSPLPWWRKPTRIFGVGPKYETDPKREILTASLRPNSQTQTPCLDDLMSREISIMIVGFDYDLQRAIFFRSFPSSAAGPAAGARRIRLADAVHVSTNAPVNYFAEPAAFSYSDEQDALSRGWDGAMGGYNNPVMAGVVELLAKGASVQQIRVLSLGSALRWRPAQGEGDAGTVARASTGFFEQARRAGTSILRQPPSSAIYTAHTVLGGCQTSDGCREGLSCWPVVRLSPLVKPEKTDELGRSSKSRATKVYWHVPKTWAKEGFAFPRLFEMDMDVSRKEDLDLLDKLAKKWLADEVPNEAIRMDRDGNHELGQKTFGEAWKILDSWGLELGS